jgi:hypothetical protein
VDDDAKTPELEVKQIRTATAAGDTGFARMTTQLAATLKGIKSPWSEQAHCRLFDLFHLKRRAAASPVWDGVPGLPHPLI